ncbi:MAG: 2-polyprenylphenol 6-hydroxylase [Pseudomonadota bacterium]
MFRTIGLVLALGRAGFVLAREGVHEFVPIEELPPGARLLHRLARLIAKPKQKRGRLNVALTRLGPNYIKLGQFLATRRDLVGADVAADLETLQDRLPPFSDKIARETIATALGQPVEDLFDEIGPAIAAASIAQVHQARIGNEHVAVKVLRPNIEARFTRDLRVFEGAARLVERVDPRSKRLKPVAVVETLDRSVRIEMDLRMEAAAISEMAENIADDPGFRVPSVDWQRSSKRVLTLEWIDGIPIADVERLKAAGHDLPHLGQTVIQSFLRHAMRDGYFHADMHPGNLFVDASGDIVAVDFGIMGRLGPKERRFLAEILYGFIRQDYLRAARVHFEAGYVPPQHRPEDFAQALRAIGAPIRDRKARDISMGRLLTQLFEVTELFDMQTRPELLMLQKTMVVVEGVGRRLDSDLDMWTTAEPVVSEWMTSDLGPEAFLRSAADGAGLIGRLARQGPALIERAERMAQDLSDMGRDGLRLDDETVSKIASAQARTSWQGSAALWVIALALATIAFMMIF